MGNTQTRATEKWQAANYDRGNLKAPRGTFDRIRATGAGSINGYAVRAILEALARDEAGEDLAPVYLPAEMLREAEEYGDPGEIAREALREILAEYRAGIH